MISEEQEEELFDEIEILSRRVCVYERKINLLLKEQHRMRDPERTLVCDIIANGQLLPDPNGTRYGTLNNQPTTSQ